MDSWKNAIGWTAMACAFLTLTVSARAQTTPKIHPPSSPAIRPGVVIAVRRVKAYPYALGAHKSTWGAIYCQGRSGQVPIKDTYIFRVETTSQFYDLSKVCGMSGDFRWPSSYVGGDNNDYDTWRHYEQLRRGDRVKMIFQMTTVRLPVLKCEELGMLNQSFGNVAAPTEFSSKWGKIYKSHCVYKVPIMHVRIKWSTTEVAGVGAHGTDSYVQTWDFRVVGRGPSSMARAEPVGPGYSATLPPPSPY